MAAVRWRPMSARGVWWVGLAAAVIVACAGGCWRPAQVVGVGPPSLTARTGRSEDGALSAFEAAVARDLDRQCGAGIAYRDGYHVGGEPPAGEGVCTDVVVRAFRAGGVDLRTEVARDIMDAPAAYDVPRPDRDIDYRRCRNLLVFFRRRAHQLGRDVRRDWRPGDVVFWSTRDDGRADHVGVIGDKPGEGRPVVVHHWPGQAVQASDALGRWSVVGRFRWPGPGRD